MEEGARNTGRREHILYEGKRMEGQQMCVCECVCVCVCVRYLSLSVHQQCVNTVAPCRNS